MYFLWVILTVVRGKHNFTFQFYIPCRWFLFCFCFFVSSLSYSLSLWFFAHFIHWIWNTVFLQWNFCHLLFHNMHSIHVLMCFIIVIIMLITSSTTQLNVLYFDNQPNIMKKRKKQEWESPSPNETKKNTHVAFGALIISSTSVQLNFFVAWFFYDFKVYGCFDTIFEVNAFLLMSWNIQDYCMIAKSCKYHKYLTISREIVVCTPFISQK